MWILSFLPDWTFYAIVIIGVIVLLVSRFIPIFYRSLFQAISLGLIVVGVFMSGVIHNEEKWKAEVARLEKEVLEAQAKSAVETVKIVEKIVTKKEYYRVKGEDIIQYIDREIVKYDSSCDIPNEFIEAHNKAVEQ